MFPKTSSEWTHWGQMTHICGIKLTIIGYNNGLSPGRPRAIIWTNAIVDCIIRRKKLQWHFNRNSNIFNHENAFLSEASFGRRVLSLPASVCVSVRPCVNHELVRAITHHPFKLGSPNLDHRCKRPWFRSILVFWGYWPWYSRSNLTSKSKFTPFWACPCHNSAPIEVTIFKYVTIMHLSTVQIPILAWLKLIFNSIFNFKPRPNWAFIYIIGIL